MNIGFDLISDLYLSENDNFDWDGKATSLYCLVAGNISTDLRVVAITLATLSKYYQGVFYIAGALEFEGVDNIAARVNEISRVCRRLRNVAYLHHNVVIIDGVAVLGANGWFGNIMLTGPNANQDIVAYRYDDMLYLKNSIEKLQKHLDVKKILIVTNSVPNEELYFGEIPEEVSEEPPLTIVLLSDSENKVSHWAFGTYKKIVDAVYSDINYLNNPSYGSDPYWPKRIEVIV